MARTSAICCLTFFFRQMRALIRPRAISSSRRLALQVPPRAIRAIPRTSARWRLVYRGRPQYAVLRTTPRGPCRADLKRIVEESANVRNLRTACHRYKSQCLEQASIHHSGSTREFSAIPIPLGRLRALFARAARRVVGRDLRGWDRAGPFLRAVTGFTFERTVRGVKESRSSTTHCSLGRSRSSRAMAATFQ